MTLSTRFLLCATALACPVSFAVAQDSAPDLPQTDDSYFVEAQQMLQAHLDRQPNTNRAKNVILFVGDGMSVTTVTAARILAGQQAGEDGVSHNLTIDTLPYSAFSRTYSDDAQVTDSAPSATAMTTGIKSKNDTIGLDQTVVPGECGSGKVVETIAEMAESAGYATGVISTARITHATPATMYAHTANRDWEADVDVDEAARGKCEDIASQLVNWSFGDGFEVILGGGRENFLPKTMDDPEDAGKTGKRGDGKDLTKEWLNRYGNQAAEYVWDKTGFDKVDPASTDKLLGLFERSHMQYDADRADDPAGEPSIAEMTSKAIDVLSKNEKGFVLMVEGGRIDHAHHDGNAYRALTDAIAFDEAIKAAMGKVDMDETLIVVTADHSHTLTMAGYPRRDNPILGVVVGIDGKTVMAEDGKPYTTLSYANGPGAVISSLPKEGEASAAAAPSTVAAAASDMIVRPNPADEDTEAKDYLQQSLVPLSSETHGGDDVGIYAAGPFAHLFAGNVGEQYTFHVMRHALGWDQQ